MYKKIKDFLKKIINFTKRNPLFSLIIATLIFLVLNLIINYLTTSNSINRPIQNNLETSKSAGLTLKPQDFPKYVDLLKTLPEINEYFFANYLPLSKDEEPIVNVELYKTSSRTKFDEWLKEFTNTDGINFIFNEEPTGYEYSLSLRKSHYSDLLKILPYNADTFTVSAEENNQIGIKFRIYYKNDSDRLKAISYIQNFNLYPESLNIVEIAPFKIPLDSIGE